MFDLFKKKESKAADGLSMFLEEADAAYIKAYETRSVGLLKKHFTRDCCMVISKSIVAEASSRYFSDDKFRETTWEVLSKTESTITIMKKCVYKSVKVSMGRSMKISDDYQEKWTLEITPASYIVMNVQAA